jgi:four helix bundle protein
MGAWERGMGRVNSGTGFVQTTMAIREFRELRVYQQAYDAATRIFECSKDWPKEETYSLTDQIRRSSRSVCANIAEAWRKRRYEKHFVSKLSDADAEAAETRTWLQFGRDSGYLSNKMFDELDDTYNQICEGLVNMMKDPEPWCGPSTTHEPSISYDA